MNLCFQDEVTNFQKLCFNVIKCGSLPKHVAFILDGNRRYSKKANIPLKDAYQLGLNKLFETLMWCCYLEIREVTFFALSLHNLERDRSEVDNLMIMLEIVSTSIENEIHKFLDRKIGVKIKGDISLIPETARKRLMEIEEKTNVGAMCILNLAIFYTSQDEITRAVSKIVSSKNIQSEDINEKLISKNLFIKHDVDLLIRTSGETRLSNFLLWQVSKALIVFENNMWPEFSFWNFYKILLRYQYVLKSKLK